MTTEITGRVKKIGIGKDGTTIELGGIIVDAAVRELESAIESNDASRVKDVKNQLGHLRGAELGVAVNPENLSRKRILWVDDHPSNNSFAIRVFERLGIEVISVLTTESALNNVRSMKVDLIISDCHRDENGVSNVLAGHELLNIVRDEFPATPFMFFTASMNQVNAARLKGADFATDDFNQLIPEVLKALGKPSVELR